MLFADIFKDINTLTPFKGRAAILIISISVMSEKITGSERHILCRGYFEKWMFEMISHHSLHDETTGKHMCCL